MTNAPDAATTLYGVEAELVNSIPDLQGLLNQAATEGWTQDKLNAKVSETPWYQQHGQQLRNLLTQSATDPATFQQNLANARQQVGQVAAQMGRTVDVNNLAYQMLAQGWSSDQLKSTIGSGSGFFNEGYWGAGGAGALSGDAGQLQNHMLQTAEAYGIPVTDGYVKDWVNNIQRGGDTIDGYDNLMRARAKAAYPQFADQIDGGQSLKQIADPYMATMAKTLEIPQTQITLNDPLVKQALSTRDPKTGAMTSQPLWQFEHTLKQDPRYGFTDQAKTDAYSMLNKIGSDWGFTSGGKIG